METLVLIIAVVIGIIVGDATLGMLKHFEWYRNWRGGNKYGRKKNV